MPAKTVESKTEQISITLSIRQIELLEEVASLGLFGNSRGEVARVLIMNRLEQLARDGFITLSSNAVSQTKNSANRMRGGDG